jgi:hypothetical protein
LLGPYAHRLRRSGHDASATPPRPSGRGAATSSAARNSLRLAGFGALLAGCSVGEYQYTEVEGRGGWRAEKESACVAARPPSPTITTIAAITEEGSCGMDFPLQITALSNGSVAVSPNPTLNCPFTDALEAWIANAVQPAARTRFGVEVVEINQISAYACRNRNNFGRELSEHAFGNALDVAGFKLANGREIIVQSGWNGKADEQAFLRQVFGGACAVFTTSLGPSSNIMHYNHFHIDLAKLAPDGSPKMCKPPLGEAGAVTAVAETPAEVTIAGPTAVPGAD